MSRKVLLQKNLSFYIACLLVLLGLLLFSVALTAQSEPVLPELEGRVTDTIGLVGKREKRNLEKKLAEFDRKTGSELVVVIVSTTRPLPIEEYSMRLAEKWKIGKKGRDNGVILLIAQKDRRLRIEVGYGLEPVLTDARAKGIISDTIVPYFRRGRFDEGIEAGVDRIIETIQNKESILAEEKRKQEMRKQLLQKQKEKYKRRKFFDFFTYGSIAPLAILGLILLFKKRIWAGALLPPVLYGIPTAIIGFFFDDYYLPALFLILAYWFLYFLFYSFSQPGRSTSASSGRRYSGSRSFSSSSYRSSSYSSSSSYSGSSSSYSGGGGSFGGGGASGSW